MNVLDVSIDTREVVQERRSTNAGDAEGDA
jgi:hypothetical protein